MTLRHVRGLSMLAGVTALAAVALTPATGEANPPPPAPKVLWVSKAAIPSTQADTSCTKPGYNTVQAAVNAATTGETINLCAGTYAEQVQITKSVSIVGTGSPIITLPATPADSTTACDAAFDATVPASEANEDGVAVCGAVNVTLQGVTVNASFAQPTANCATVTGYYGILVGGGATLNFISSAVTGAGAVPLNGCQGGIGIEAGSSTTTPVQVGHLNVLGSHISGYQKNGITVDGSGSSAAIGATTVTGAGPTPVIAQNGIQISDGAIGHITGSTITGDECNYPGSCGPNGLTQYGGAGFLFYAAAAGSGVSSSTISGNDEGIYYSADPAAGAPKAPGVTIANDTLINDRYQGIQLDQGDASIVGTSITGGNVGIQVLQYQGQAFGVNDTACSDTIKGESVAAVQVLSDQASTGDYPGTFTIEHSRFLTGNAASVLDNSKNLKVIQSGNS